MPIYEYRCKSCGTLIEVMQKFGDPAKRRCRKCSGRLEKLVSRTSFQLKGGGWYASGYDNRSKSGDSTSGTKTASDSSKTSDKSSSGSSDKSPKKKASSGKSD